MNGLLQIDRTAFTPGRLVITSLGPDRSREFEVVKAGRDSVVVRDPKTGRRFKFPLEHLAVVDLEREDADHIDSYANYKKDGKVSTTSKLADAVSTPRPNKGRGRPDSYTNEVRKRIKLLKAANPYLSEEVEPEEEYKPKRRDVLDYMDAWRE